MHLKKLFILIPILFSQIALADFSGTYIMKIKIGEQVFNDILVLEVETPIPGLPNTSDLKGSITVPNRFSSPLIGSITCSSWTNFCHLYFEIVAHENGQDFKVFYYGFYEGKHINNQPSFTGHGELEKGEFLGDFEAIRQP